MTGSLPNSSGNTVAENLGDCILHHEQAVMEIFRANAAARTTWKKKMGLDTPAANMTSKIHRITAKTVMLGGGKTQLPAHFVPSEHDVLCGKGKECFDHPGNIQVRALIEAILQRYTKSTSKIEKSSIINSIVDEIRTNAPNGGGFVRQDKKTGVWFEIGDVLARDKVGHIIREMMTLKDPKKIQRKRRNRAAFNKRKQSQQEKEKSSRSTLASSKPTPQNDLCWQDNAALDRSTTMSLPPLGPHPEQQGKPDEQHSALLANFVPAPMSSSVQGTHQHRNIGNFLSSYNPTMMANLLREASSFGAVLVLVPL